MIGTLVALAHSVKGGVAGALSKFGLAAGIAVVAGVGSVGAGLVQAVTREPTLASRILTIIAPTVITLWWFIMGILMARRSRRA